MITITLENERNQVIEKIGEHDNREYLLKYTDNPAYNILSEISNYDHEIVLSEDTPELIAELESIKTDLMAKQISHVDEIIRLARIAQKHKGYALIITPFD
ncbi:MAG: hypothetical protein H0X72_18450 [Acidobacteria bacterium]|jgi:hypothetical protein|nr:hypothetical protein [Acidobacteriota bacterium]